MELKKGEETMKIRQQRTIEKNICKKMILLSFCMILMVSMAGCGNKKRKSYDHKCLL